MEEKKCSGCKKVLPLVNFGSNRAQADNLDYYCRTCRMEASQRKRKREDGDDTPEEEDTCEGDALYVLHNSLAPHQSKVGRSKDPERRRRDMQASQNFTVHLDAVFPGRGWMEPLVHARLAPRRVPDVPGREWFEAPLADILKTVANCVCAEEPLIKKMELEANFQLKSLQKD